LTVRLFIPVGAMLGAAAFTVAPIPGQAKIDLGQAAMAGLGGVVGAAIGTVVGLLFDWVFKDRSPARAAAPAPNAVENAFRIGPATRR
jgi:hypothetical protein